jgi:fluoride exporter
MSPRIDNTTASHGVGWRWRTGPAVLFAVALGGMLGASARYVLSEVVSRDPASFPVATFAENVGGSLLLGFALVTIVRRYPPARYLRPFVATGFLGSFTTFSALVIEGELLVRDGRAVLAATYWVTTLAAGLVAAFVGIAAARSLSPDRRSTVQ